MNLNDDRSPLIRFEDEVTHLIDHADGQLTISEMVGVLELQLHVLKCRFYPGTKREESK